MLGFATRAGACTVEVDVAWSSRVFHVSFSSVCLVPEPHGASGADTRQMSTSAFEPTGASMRGSWVTLSVAVTLAACTRSEASKASADTPAAATSGVPAVGRPAPVFAVATLGGDSTRVGGPARQPVTLVNVWATWCAPCKAEFPELQALHAAYAPKGLRVVADLDRHRRRRGSGREREVDGCDVRDRPRSGRRGAGPLRGGRDSPSRG